MAMEYYLEISGELADEIGGIQEDHSADIISKKEMISKVTTALYHGLDDVVLMTVMTKDWRSVCKKP